MIVDEITSKAHKMILGCKTDEQLRGCARFIEFLRKNYPQADTAELEEKLKQKDLDLHKKV